MARPSPERISLPYFWTRNINGTITTGSITPNGNPVPYRYNRTWSGSFTAGYHGYSRRAKMKLPVLNHTYRTTEATGTPYKEITLVWNAAGNPITLQTYDISSAAALSSVPSATHLADAYTKARARLADKVNSMDVNLAQAFGERKQTANLLANSAVRIALAMRHLKHGELRDFSRALNLEGRKVPSAKQWESVIKTPVADRLSRHWLAFQYGWKPLVQDAFGVADLLSKHSQERYVTKSEASATARETWTIPFTPATMVEIIHFRITRVRMASVYRLDDMTTQVLAQTGISNPALLAWELLPWSFVIDWFTPVGNYLQALNAFAGFTFVQGWVSQKTKVTRLESRNGVKPKAWNGSSWVQVNTFGSSTYEETLYERNVINSFPAVGALGFKNPIGGEPLARFATAAALMQQLRSR